MNVYIICEGFGCIWNRVTIVARNDQAAQYILEMSRHKLDCVEDDDDMGEWIKRAQKFPTSYHQQEIWFNP